MVFLFKQELSTFIAFAIINGACRLMILIDKLIFSKRTLTAILLLYTPLNIIGVALPEGGEQHIRILVRNHFVFCDISFGACGVSQKMA